jgi:hypothetical protein
MMQQSPNQLNSLRDRFARHMELRRDLYLLRLAPASLLAGILLAVIWTCTAYPPFDFGAPRVIKIKPGATLSSEARELKAAHAIRQAII